MATVISNPLTTAELLALPDDGIERWLIQGQLREGSAVTIRNRWHTFVEGRLAQLLGNWLDAQPSPRGELHAGEVGVRLARSPDTTVGVDLVLISAQLAAAQGGDSSIIEGVPILAAEILSPYDRIDEIEEKIDAYLAAGVQAVWVANPYRRTIMVARPDLEAETFNSTQTLRADPYLPGLSIAVASVFSR